MSFLKKLTVQFIDYLYCFGFLVSFSWFLILPLGLDWFLFFQDLRCIIRLFIWPHSIFVMWAYIALNFFLRAALIVSSKFCYVVLALSLTTSFFFFFVLGIEFITLLLLGRCLCHLAICLAQGVKFFFEKNINVLFFGM